MFNLQAAEQQIAPKAIQLIQAIGQLTTLRCLDLSKNNFPDSVCLKLIETMPKLPRLQILALSKVNLSDVNVY